MGTDEFREQGRIEQRDRLQTEALQRIAAALESIAAHLKGTA